MIVVEATADGVEIEFSSPAGDRIERVYAQGVTLSEAIHNLMDRFEELHGAALSELRERGFVTKTKAPPPDEEGVS